MVMTGRRAAIFLAVAAAAVLAWRLAMPSDERRKLWSERRTQMLSDKVDCAQFLTWFIENYPQSAEQTRNADKEFWKQFK